VVQFNATRLGVAMMVVYGVAFIAIFRNGRTMRLKYVFPSSSAEDSERLLLEKRIDFWWKEFERKATDLPLAFRGKLKWDYISWMQEEFHKIHPEVMWEFGPGVNGGERLAICAESNFVLQPLVDFIIERAPAIPNWTFLPYRPPVEMEWVQIYTKARADASLTPGAFKVKVSLGKYNKIDLSFYSPTYSEARHDEELKLAGTAAQYLLGEEIFYYWLGNFNLEPLSFMKSLLGGGLVPLDKLKPRVDVLISAVRDQLYNAPMWKGGWNAHFNGEAVDPRRTPVGSVYKLEPKTRDVYPNWTDEFAAVSQAPIIWEATHLDPEFSSRRFSKHSEIFCYLKIDTAEIPNDKLLSNRHAIQDGLEKLLYGAHAGTITGGGTGTLYSYIDLALDDVRAAIDSIRRCFREMKLTHNAWLLFYDIELAKEWVGVADDTQPPPGYDL
jgi:hypothetical protein